MKDIVAKYKCNDQACICPSRHHPLMIRQRESDKKDLYCTMHTVWSVHRPPLCGYHGPVCTATLATETTTKSTTPRAQYYLSAVEYTTSVQLR